MIFVAMVLASLLGAIPFGLLVAKAKGINIREVGSGNIGATNVFRSVSKQAGLLTFALDVLKGFVPSFFFCRWFAIDLHWGLALGVLAIVGHSFSCFVKFKGGKGVATSAGMLLGVAPLAIGIALIGWIAVLLLSGYVSLASIVGSVLVMVGGWFFYDGAVPMALTLLGALVIYRHRANIGRLKNGTESRFNVGRFAKSKKK